MFRLSRQVLEWHDNQNEEMKKIYPFSLNYPHMILRRHFFLEYVKIRKFNWLVSLFQNQLFKFKTYYYSRKR